MTSKCSYFMFKDCPKDACIKTYKKDKMNSNAKILFFNLFICSLIAIYIYPYTLHTHCNIYIYPYICIHPLIAICIYPYTLRKNQVQHIHTIYSSIQIKKINYNISIQSIHTFINTPLLLPHIHTKQI
jgi:hypothetical protein